MGPFRTPPGRGDSLIDMALRQIDKGGFRALLGLCVIACIMLGQMVVNGWNDVKRLSHSPGTKAVVCILAAAGLFAFLDELDRHVDGLERRNVELVSENERLTRDLHELRIGLAVEQIHGDDLRDERDRLEDELHRETVALDGCRDDYEFEHAYSEALRDRLREQIFLNSPWCR